jgi:hypothetical protein
MLERWVEFKEGYSVSDYGRVRTNSSGKIWTPQQRDKRKLGYLSVYIKGKNYSIHRLVAEAFVHNSNKEIFKVVNHLDNNPSNNHWTNLEWTNQKGNVKHCKEQGRHTCDNNELFIKQKNEKNKPSKVRKAKTKNLPIGVFEVKYKNGIKYHARFSNTTVGYIGLGTFDTIYDAYQAVKSKYKEIYGVYPPDQDPEYVEPTLFKSAKHKLNEEQAREIKKSNLKIEELAKLYNVSKSCIKDIKNGYTWKHV